MRIIDFLWALVFVLSSCKEKPATSIVLKNPINEERVDESFRLSRMELRAVGDELLPVVKKADGTYIPCQVDDMDQDGLWDELAFVYTLGGHETVELLLDWMSAAEYPLWEDDFSGTGGRIILRYAWKAESAPFGQLSLSDGWTGMGE